MRSMMESFERWSINGEPDAPRDARPVPREDCRNLCPKGIRRCFPTLLRGRFLVLLVAGLDRQQPPDGGSAQRGRGSQPGQRTGAARRGQRQLLYVSCISRRHGDARAPGQWRDRRKQCRFGQEQYRGQQCLESEHGHRAHGKTTVQGGLWLHIHQRQYGGDHQLQFSGVHVRAQGHRYLLDSNWSGDNGAIKVYSKTTSQALIIVGGNFSSSRNVDWIAIGT